MDISSETLLLSESERYSAAFTEKKIPTLNLNNNEIENKGFKKKRSKIWYISKHRIYIYLNHKLEKRVVKMI